jgi:hypothetical protein
MVVGQAEAWLAGPEEIRRAEQGEPQTAQAVDQPRRRTPIARIRDDDETIAPEALVKAA